MEFLEIYRGAGLYKLNDNLDVPDKDILNKKVGSVGYHPTEKNLKIDFSAEGNTWEEAIDKVTQKIDQYLDEHELQEFAFQQLKEL